MDWELAKLRTSIVNYGAPVLPGAMFMLGYKKDIPSWAYLPAGCIIKLLF